MISSGAYCLRCALTSRSRDERTIKLLSAGVQQREYTKLIRSQDPRYVNVWKFHGERNPSRVVSIRALEAYYGAKPPRMGSRLAIQAVVRFDTMQVRCHAGASSSPFDLLLYPERGDILEKDWGSHRGDSGPARDRIPCVPKAHVV